MTKLTTLSLLLLTSLGSFAQQGNRKGHDNMDPVVPEKLIPEAPVLSVEEALKTFKLDEGFVIEPVAAEPLTDTPVALVFDEKNRMWVCELRGYMTDIDGSEENKPMGRIVILEDSDQDGKADKSTVFLDNLLLPRSIALVKDGILFGDQEKLYFVKRDGDKPAGEPVVVDADYAKGGNVEHKSNGLLPALDNWLYNAKSASRYKRVGDKWVEEATHFRGQWGIAQDNYGRLYHNTNSNWLRGDQVMPNLLQGNPAAKLKVGMDANLGSNRVYPSRVTPGLNRAYIAKSNGYDSDTLDPKTFKLINTTAACGPVVYRGTNFPEKMHGWAFACESGVNLVKAVAIEEKDGRLKGSHPYKDSEFLTSTDERFRPVNLFNAPDGTLYLVDMYHGIIQHKTYMTTYLREQTLARKLEGPGLGKGRIYRIRYTKNKLHPTPDLSQADTLTLAKTLGSANGWHRDTAQRLLVEQHDPTASELVRKWLSSDNTLAKLHALWTLEGLGTLNAADLQPLLKADDEHLVASATYAALSLLPGERAKLEIALSTLPDTQAVLPYKARALASLKSPTADQALADLLDKHGKTKFVKEAAISGLAKTAGQFAKNHPPKDKQFKEWIDNTLKGVQKEVKPETYLSGEHLASHLRGKELFQGEAGCIGCHGADGTGLPNLGPTLDNSDWVTGSEDRLVKILLHGLSGPIKINGKTFTPLAFMPGLAQNPSISDQDMADILTYTRSAWSNRASAISKDSVSKIRKDTADRAGQVYTQADFK
ncbi:MAG: DUF7133 domain-containing protein [Verrucomicrobiales bacterium]